MKRKNGFTLAELLGVVIILGLLALLIFPNIIKQLKEGKQNISSSVEQLIFNSVENYMLSNQTQYPTNIDTTYCFTLQQLVDNGEITKGLLIDEEGKALKLSKKVEIIIENQQKTYKMNDNCIET